MGLDVVRGNLGLGRCRNSPRDCLERPLGQIATASQWCYELVHRHRNESHICYYPQSCNRMAFYRPLRIPCWIRVSLLLQENAPIPRTVALIRYRRKYMSLLCCVVYLFWLKRGFNGRRLKLGDIHPNTLESWHNLIELYEAWGKPEKAEEWRKKLPQTKAEEQ